MEAHIYEKIEAYLTSRLSDLERQVFEKTISEDSVLKETVVKMQLLRKITERNLTRSKVMSIHTAKTSEWKRSIGVITEEEETVPTIEKNEIADEVNETVVIDEPNNRVTEIPDLIEAEHEHEEEAFEDDIPRRSGWLPIVWLTVLLLGVAIAGFIYLAKSPIEIRRNNSLVAATTQTDSTQQVYLGIYNDGVQALQSGNSLAAISYFNEVIDTQKLPNYHTDAARFLALAAYAHQQPNKAAKNLSAITSQPTFAYPYTNKDKLQIQCKILWARLMGWND